MSSHACREKPSPFTRRSDHKIENFALYLMIAFLEVLDGTLVVLNRPSQAASGPGRWSSACRDFRGELPRGNGLEVFDVFLDELGGVKGLGAAGLPCKAREREPPV